LSEPYSLVSEKKVSKVKNRSGDLSAFFILLKFKKRRAGNRIKK